MLIEELNEERKRQGLSVEELAEKSNLPKSTVEKVIFGVTKDPRKSTIDAIKRALGLSEEGYRDTLPFEVTPMEEELVRTFRTLSEEDKQLLFILMKKIK